MWVSEISVFDRDLAWRLLFQGLGYDGSCGDLLMVLGSRKAVNYRVPAAVELFEQKRAPLILLSGGKVQETGIGVMAEHIAMKKAALSLGVPESALLTEERSLTTAENFIFSNELIRERLPGCRTVILVTAAYHMRRALCMAKKLMPDLCFVPCPVEKGSAAPAVWHDTPKGYKTVLDECEKFGYYIREGLIDDFEI
ncbi:MAG: YdcF family protein [Ruminococcus sp.]|nr:YdcF family protein [Ruminococcus sp.]